VNLVVVVVQNLNFSEFEGFPEQCVLMCTVGIKCVGYHIRKSVRVMTPWPFTAGEEVTGGLYLEDDAETPMELLEIPMQRGCRAEEAGRWSMVENVWV